jgi:dTMP kinase
VRAPGRLIAFEGGEACGKSTQAVLLAEALGARATREPGGTALGASLRGVLLDPATGALDARAELALMVADRAQHVAEVVRPTLAAGRHVVTDRYSASSIAYQGYGRGMDPERVTALCAWATDDLWPDLTILLDVPVAVAAVRLGGQRDRFEREGDGFHERVRQGFLALAAADPVGWVVLDGTAPVADVSAAIAAVVGDRLQLPG